ncbi:MAG: Maf family protein [Imperialibacter sp.]
MILASNSPRRQQLLKEAGFSFEVYTEQVDESYPDSIKKSTVGEYLARKKSDFYGKKLSDAIIVTADTTVVLDNQLLEKPADSNEAYEMLTRLSGRSHDVITGVCIAAPDGLDAFSVSTRVTFKELTNEEINYYISNYKPFDKAGAYGIQEWIGMIGITGIEGSYFNVVGLPVQELFAALSKYKM